MTRFRTPYLATIALLIAGCATADILPSGPDGFTPPPDGQVLVKLDQAAYTPGAVVGVRLTNQTEQTLAYNLCSARFFDRLEGDAWVTMPPELRLCTADMRMLGGRSTSEATTDLPLDFNPGMYRMGVKLFGMVPGTSPQDAPVVAYSIPFTVN